MSLNLTGNITTDTVEKWSPVLEGITNEYTRKVTAQLLENQAKAIISDRLNEDIASDNGGMTAVGSLGSFQKFAFPLVRRVYPELIANNIVGVQPMQGPVSQIFYLGNSRRDGVNANLETIYSKYNLTYKGNMTGPIFGNGGPKNSAGEANYDLDTGRLNPGVMPGDLAVPASMNDVSSLVSGVSGGPTGTVGGDIANWPAASVNRGISTGPAQLMGFNVSAGERLSGSGIPEMVFHIEQQPVAARTRKMRALWTLEAAQDLRAYHNLDLEAELTDLLSKELRLEIDRELIEDLRMLAYGFGSNRGTNQGGTGFNRRGLDQAQDGNPGINFNFEPDFTNASSFSYDFENAYKGGNEDKVNNVFMMDFSSSAIDFAPQHVGHVYANLLSLCHIVSQDIYKTTMRGPGNFMVCSPLIAALLQSAAKLEGGIASTDGPTNMGQGTIEYKGKLAGAWDLYIDPMYPEDEIMIGYKGANAMDSGYVYCPYIPLQQLPTITDPETFQPKKGILTRYGKAEVSPASRFYRIIRLVGPTANYLFTPFVKTKSNAFA